MKIIILSTDKSILKWKSLPKKLNFIKKALSVWEVEIKNVEVIPVVENNKVSSNWLSALINPYFNQGYDIVALHMSDKQRLEWGIMPSLRGYNPNSGKEYGDFYFWSDELTKREGLSQFIQTCLHELGHEYYQQTGQTDVVHWYHSQNPDITGLIESFDWTLYQPKRMALKKQVSFLERVVELLTKRLLAKDVDMRLLPCVERGVEAIILEMQRKGHPVRVVQGYRPIEEQNKLYAQGRTTPGAVVTNAKGGESFHNYRCAVDFVFRKEGYNASPVLWETLGAVGEKQGFSWGGRWKGFVDMPHFEMTAGYKLADFQKGKVDYSKFN